MQSSCEINGSTNEKQLIIRLLGVNFKLGNQENAIERHIFCGGLFIYLFNILRRAPAGWHGKLQLLVVIWYQKGFKGPTELERKWIVMVRMV